MSSDDPRLRKTTSILLSPPYDYSPLASTSAPLLPRSSTSPPDEALALAPSTHSRPEKDKGPRKVPCLACRSIRRVCKWIEGTNECERCLKQGMRCSGPKKRRLLDPKKAAYFPPPTNDDDALVSIGFSSPAAQWMDQNLSYSLTFHLVETCRNVADVMPFGGLWFGNFVASFNQSMGRTAELTGDQELLASVYMYFGTQFTNHSGILGAGVDVPSFDQVVSASDLTLDAQRTVADLRHAPLRSVGRILVERLESIDHFSGTADEAAERLLLCHMAVEALDGGSAEAQRRLAGRFARKGIGLLRSVELGEEGRGMLEFAVQGHIRCEIRQSLLLGYSTSISHDEWSAHDIAFGLAELCSPSNALVDDFLLDPNPVTLPHPHPGMELVYDSFEAYLSNLHSLLAYSTPSTVLQVVGVCLERLDTFAKFVSTEIARMLERPAYAALSPLLRSKRPDGAVNNYVLFRVMSLETHIAVQRVLARACGSSDLAAVCEQGLYKTLDDLAYQMPLAMETLYESRPVRTFFVVQRLVIALQLIHSTILPDWASTASTELREGLLGVFRLASFCTPQAAKLVAIVEEVSMDLETPTWSPLLSVTSSNSAQQSPTVAGSDPSSSA